MLRRARFFFLCFVGWGLVSFLEISLLRVGCQWSFADSFSPKIFSSCGNVFVVTCLGASPLTKAMIIWPRNRMPKHVEISIFPKVFPSHSSCSSVLIAFVFSKLTVTFADICLFFVFFLAFSRSNVVWHNIRSSITSLLWQSLEHTKYGVPLLAVCYSYSGEEWFDA